MKMGGSQEALPDPRSEARLGDSESAEADSVATN